VPDSAASAPAWAVRWSGAQRDVLGGDVSGKVPLGPLGQQRSLYALGPLEGVRGEVSVLDGVGYISRVRHGAIEVEQTLDVRACFLVYAHVPDWLDVRWNALLDGMEAIERAVITEAGARSIDVSAPFPFRLTGQADRLDLHVLDKRDGSPHDKEGHERAKVRFVYRDEPVEVLGFFSTRHRGIFTPGESNVHVHAVLRNGEAAGHVDGLTLGPGASLWLPPSRGGKDEHR
jgi:acetolactate decarboxylase